MKTIKNKHSADVEGNERHHAVAMKYEFMEKIMGWSLSVVPEDVSSRPFSDKSGRTRMLRHAMFRAFLATGWTLWLRYAGVIPNDAIGLLTSASETSKHRR